MSNEWVEAEEEMAEEYAAPRKPFVRLSEEEIEAAYGNSGHYQTLRPQDRFGVFALARAIEDALEEKNK